MDAETGIVYGIEPKFEIKVNGGPESAYEAGEQKLTVDWSSATADGYCIILVTDPERGESAVYGLACPKNAPYKFTTITLDLKVAAYVTVTADKGKMPLDVNPITDDFITFGTAAQPDDTGDGTGETGETGEEVPNPDEETTDPSENPADPAEEPDVPGEEHESGEETTPEEPA